jgi:hypothetical protein
MLKIGLVAVVVLVAGVLVAAATRPDTFRVSRTTTIQAPAERIYAFIHDFDRWGAWSPYEKKDPAMKRSFAGPAAGKGAVYAWVDFTLQPKGDATEVTWAMRGPMPFVSKLITLFIDMDRMVGGDFEAGLANLKAVAER